MTTLTVSATEANRSFSALLQKVRDGARVTITAHGKVVAEIIPPSNDQSERARFQAFVDRIAARPFTQIEPWSRDTLYDR